MNEPVYAVLIIFGIVLAAVIYEKIGNSSGGVITIHRERGIS